MYFFCKEWRNSLCFIFSVFSFSFFFLKKKERKRKNIKNKVHFAKQNLSKALHFVSLCILLLHAVHFAYILWNKMSAKCKHRDYLLHLTKSTLCLQSVDFVKTHKTRLPDIWQSQMCAVLFVSLCILLMPLFFLKEKTPYFGK